MSERNDVTDKVNALQNQFTAYLVTALRRTRIRYLHNADKHNRELPLDDFEFALYETEDPAEIADNAHDFEVLYQELKEIRERERYILIARVIGEKSFTEIAGELNMGYKAVSMEYYRVLKKLRRRLGGEMNDEF